MNEEAARGRLVELLQLADAHAGTHHPAEQPDLTRDQGLVLALYANCRAMLRGITFLLREEHGQEATILMRTLLQDATTVFYVFKNQPTTGEMTVRFEWGSVRQERLILEEAMKHAPDTETKGPHSWRSKPMRNRRRRRRRSSAWSCSLCHQWSSYSRR